MSKGIDGGFLESNEDDVLIDKFIDNEGNVSEEELAKLEGKEHAKKSEPEDAGAELGEQEEPRENAPTDEEDLGGDGEEAEGAKPKEPDAKPDKSEVESNQAKAIRIERERRKELEKQLRIQAERSAKIEQVLTQVLQPQANQDPKEVIPDPEEDPIGHQNYKIAKLEQLQRQHQEQLRQQQEYAQQAQQREQFISAYANSAKQYAQENPQFMDAYKHLVQSRLNEHLAAGYDEHTANELLKQEEAAIVDGAFRRGENPAERIFKVAQARGFSGIPAAPQKPVSKLESVKQGLQKGKTLGPNSGDADIQDIDLNNLESMTDAQLDKVWHLAKAGKLSFN